MASSQQQNVDIVREGYEAFNEGDIDTVLERFDENIEWIEPERSRYGGTYHGPDAVVENVFEPTLSDVDDLQVEPDRFIDGGETVVALGHFRGTVAESGEDVEIPFAHAIDLADGRFVRFQNYTDTAQFERALEA